MAPLDAQIEELRKRFAEVALRPLSSGSKLVCVSPVPLPAGWSKPTTTIRFLVPPGYPHAALDCFWADADLLLAGGRMPQSAGPNAIPEVGEPGLWFSWHLTHPWNPNRDTLSSWMNTILDRMRRVQ